MIAICIKIKVIIIIIRVIIIIISSSSSSIVLNIINAELQNTNSCQHNHKKISLYSTAVIKYKLKKKTTEKLSENTHQDVTIIVISIIITRTYQMAGWPTVFGLT